MGRKSIALILISTLLVLACAGVPGLPQPTPTALPQPSDLPPLGAAPGGEGEITETPEAKIAEEEPTEEEPTEEEFTEEEPTEDGGEELEESEEFEEEEDPAEVPELDTISSDTAPNLKVLTELNTSNVGHMALSPLAETLAVGEGNTIVLYNMPWPEGVIKLTGHTGDINALSWASDGSQLASASDDGSVRIWDTTTEEEVSKLDIDGSAVLALAWSPDGTLIAAGTRKGAVKVIDAETGEITQTIQVSPQGVPLGAISWSSDSSTFVAALYQGPVNPGDISIWDALTGEEVEGGAIRRNYTAPGPTGVAYSPYDDTIAWPNNNNLGQVSLYTVDDDKNSVVFAGQNKVGSIAWSSDGSLIATGGADHMVFIWDPLDGTALTQLKGHRDTITTVCWSSDDTFIVSVSADGIIKVWGTPLE